MTDGKYAKATFAETTPDSYTNPTWNGDHPSVIGALGMLPGPQIDAKTMHTTLRLDYEELELAQHMGLRLSLMLAMTAARLGDPERAVSALLLDTKKNKYGLNGRVYQSRS